MDELIIIGIIAGIVVSINFIGAIIHYVRKLEPYPFCIITRDISGRKRLTTQQFIEECLCELCNRMKISNQKQNALEWKQRMYKAHPTQKTKIDNIYNENYEKDIIFQGYRYQTRYIQRNYQRYPHRVENLDINAEATLEYCEDLIEKLKKLNFEMTIEEAHSKDQRKLMTADLRKQVKERDNYTCKKCGKYMPDEVGLHIDHITPVSRGGLTVLSNLQVLCSKCNGRKGNKKES